MRGKPPLLGLTGMQQFDMVTAIDVFIRGSQTEALKE
jgi:hypothetical protein